MIDPIKGLAKLATVKFTSVFETLLVAETRAKMTEFVLKGLANGTLKPVIDKTFPLEHIVEAYRYLESNQVLETTLFRRTRGADQHSSSC